jgi:CheY-like chemotaxis protein
VATDNGVATVLVVDDEEVLRSYMARVLQSEGYSVIEAENGVEALRFLSRKDTGVVVDLVITDVRMPIMGGRDLAATLAQGGASPPVLFVSGSHTSSDVSGPLLRKPFLPGDLSAFARALLQLPPDSSSYEPGRARPR